MEGTVHTMMMISNVKRETESSHVPIHTHSGFHVGLNSEQQVLDFFIQTHQHRFENTSQNVLRDEAFRNHKGIGWAPHGAVILSQNLCEPRTIALAGNQPMHRIIVRVKKDGGTVLARKVVTRKVGPRKVMAK